MFYLCHVLQWNSLDVNQIVTVQDDGYQSVLTATECFVMLHRTCGNTSGSMKASNHLSAICVDMHVAHAATLQHTCCGIPLRNRSYVTAAARHTSRGLLCDGTSAATSTGAFLNVTGTCYIFITLFLYFLIEC